MYHFCTYFDHNYLLRGLALYWSLRRHCSPFRLWALCMDDISHEVLYGLNLPNMELIALKELEEDDTELQGAKGNRTTIEYYFTCTPSLPLFILNRVPQIDMITYLDADIFFFANPAPIYEEIADQSIAIIGHRWPPHSRAHERYGIYNVGWVSFRQDENAIECLNRWRDQCIEWCYDRVEDGRFADQKYLDEWPYRYKGVVVLKHQGANLAPWNLENYTIRVRGDDIWVDEQQLIFYHFQGFKRVYRWLYDLGLAEYGARLSPHVKRSLYRPYIRTLRRMAERFALPRSDLPIVNSIRGEDPSAPSPSHISLTRRGARRAAGLLSLTKRILARDYVFLPESLTW